MRISKRQGPTVACAAALARLSKWQSSEGDTYIGEREDLIVAGLIRANQFPGQPGIGKTRATFYDGKLCGRSPGPVGTPRDARYLRVEWRGPTRFAVIVGIPDDERARRQRKEEEEGAARRVAYEAARIERIEREGLMGAIGAINPPLAPTDSGQNLAEHQGRVGEFKVGDVVLYDGELVEITGEFGVREVRDHDKSLAHRPCYVVRRPGGETWWARAGGLLQEDWEVRHIRLVSTT